MRRTLWAASSDVSSNASESDVSSFLGFAGGAGGGYLGSTRPLRVQPEHPLARMLMHAQGAQLPSAALTDQYERAQLYVARHPEEFQPPHDQILQVGLG